jgi:hypothetical protein
LKLEHPSIGRTQACSVQSWNSDSHPTHRRADESRGARFDVPAARRIHRDQLALATAGIVGVHQQPGFVGSNRPSTSESFM